MSADEATSHPRNAEAMGAGESTDTAETTKCETHNGDGKGPMPTPLSAAGGWVMPTGPPYRHYPWGAGAPREANGGNMVPKDPTARRPHPPLAPTSGVGWGQQQNSASTGDGALLPAGVTYVGGSPFG